MSRSVALYALIALWCCGIFLTVPTGPNPYGRNSRWWLSYQLFGGRRGAVMLGGLLAISFVYGLVFAGERP